MPYIKTVNQIIAGYKYPQGLSYYHRAVRYLSFWLTPMFIMLGLSANQVTLLSLISGILASVAIISGMYCLGIALFFMYVMLDFIDGNISRYKDSATYWGKYIDGLSGCFVEFLFPMALGFCCYGLTSNTFLLYYGALAAVASVMFSLAMERHYNFVRWCGIMCNPPKTKGNAAIRAITRVSYDFRIISLLISVTDLRIYGIGLYLFAATVCDISGFVYFFLLSRDKLMVHRKSIQDATGVRRE
jgi:phosphatidylglycerophosphate synthase